MKVPINSREDVSFFVKQFYNQLLNDPDLKHFFQNLVENDQLPAHLEIITDFWNDILFSTNSYQRNAMAPHLKLNKTKAFTSEHFKAWLTHFNTTIETHFTGELVEKAKTRALSIATVMQIKMINSQNK